MRKHFYILTLLACLLGFVGCQKENEPPAGKDYNTIITVKADTAKTHYNPSTHGVEWDSDDQISVIRGNSGDGNDFSAFDFISQENGEARFGSQAVLPSSGMHYAVYPAQEGLSISEGILSFVDIQPSQTLTENSFGKGNNTAVGFNATTTMPFRNVGGLAKIAVRGTAKVKSITITNNGSDPLSGRGSIDIMSDDLKIVWDENNSSNEVTAFASDQTNGESVSGGKMFYIVLPPCTLDNYTVTITDVDDFDHSVDFTTSMTISRATVTMLGAFEVNKPQIDSRFSVWMNKKVFFASGNLVYANGAYSFAEHQYDYGSYFAWGTGNDPTYVSTDPTKDYVKTFDDWGNYFDGGIWRTLTNDEWIYVLYLRPSAEQKRGLATVNGVHGMVLLPDVWTRGDFNAGVENGWATNVYDAASWRKMEVLGAVFLPAAGFREYGDGMLEYLETDGYYWSATGEYFEEGHPVVLGDIENKAYTVHFDDDSYTTGGVWVRALRMPVRLVRDDVIIDDPDLFPILK